LSTPSFSIGIEEEYQTVDPETRDLRSHIAAEIIEKGRRVLQERVKPEMHQSVIEVGTGVCHNMVEARSDLMELRSGIIRLARENGLRLAAAGTHPFSDWRNQEIFPDERYHTIVEDLKMVARANLIFGLHVHVGVEDREVAIHLMNAARYFVPHILALSTNSPFWLGMDTGLKSYRCKVFDKFPRTNIPDYFPSYGEYESFITCSSRPSASITPRKSGGTSACILTSRLSNSASATSPCGSTKLSPSPPSSRPPSPSSTAFTNRTRVSASIAAR
jgi:carboxylate-amine ligase